MKKRYLVEYFENIKLQTCSTEALKARQHDPEENVRFEVVVAIFATAKKDFEVVSSSEDLLNVVKVT